jgi:hypothetical protein
LDVEWGRRERSSNSVLSQLRLSYCNIKKDPTGKTINHELRFLALKMINTWHRLLNVSKNSIKEKKYLFHIPCRNLCCCNVIIGLQLKYPWTHLLIAHFWTQLQ